MVRPDPMTASRDALTYDLKKQAQGLGFRSVGVCPAVEPPGMDRFREWLRSGYAGEMQYLADRVHAYEHPRHVMDGVRSVVMLTMNYDSRDPHKVSDAVRYDQLTYHDVLTQDLKVMDASAVSLCRENEIPILVFSIHNSGEFAKVVTGNGRFTIICGEDEQNV